ncbi:alpha/beta hydrolase fold domain-containing protein [Geodermatophilus sp. SYSU D00700]
MTRKRSLSTPARARERMAAPKKAAPPPEALRQRHDVHTRDVGGFACHTVAPRGIRAQRAAVYLHGGAYISPMSPQHWTLVSRLADAGLRVEVPDYGLAPQHTYREAYPFVVEVYRQLLAEAEPTAITLAGDSAGGGLALGVAQTLPDVGLPHPRRLQLIAPWLDLALANPDIPASERRDPWLSSAGLREVGRAWAGGDDPADPRLSPIHGPLTGLPPIDVHVGTRDLFHPDALRLQQRAADEQHALTLTVCQGGVHVYPLTPTPEGRAAAAAIVHEMAA